MTTETVMPPETPAEAKSGGGVVLQRLVSLRPVRSGHAYGAGYDCGLNGVNTTNCHFKYFGTKELTKEWERGKADAEREKQANAGAKARGD